MIELVAIIMTVLIMLYLLISLVSIWTREYYTTCPKCGAATMEQGYEGIRRKCSRCDWSNSK